MEDKNLYCNWRKLINMSREELLQFKKTQEGKEAGLSKEQAKQLNIKSGQESSEWLVRMIPSGRTYAKAKANWTPAMWSWAQKQVSFNKRMRGIEGPLFKNKEKTRKHTSLLIWGHNPLKKLRKCR